MAWRKWLVRGLVYASLGLFVLGAVLYQISTNPATVRRQLLEKLSDRLPGGIVTLESAHLRLLGGIEVRDLRLARRDDLDHGDFLYAPSALIYHDKERLLGGDLAIRKIELQRPRLRLVRDRAGVWNLVGLTPSAPGPITERLPVVVVQNGTLVLEDQALSATPLCEIHDIHLTAINDPLTVIGVEATGTVDLLGPVRLHARIDRGGGLTTVSLDLNAVPVGPLLIQRVTTLYPDVAAHLRQLSGSGTIHANLTFQGGAKATFHYDISAGLKDASFSHARLPFALHQVEGSIHCVDGRIPLAHVVGQADKTRVELTMHDLLVPPSAPTTIADIVDSYDLSVEHVALTPELLSVLPSEVVAVLNDYKPAGVFSVNGAFRHESGGWRKTWCTRPEGATANYCRFPYPLEQVTGTVDTCITSSGSQRVSIDLRGIGRGAPVSVKGLVDGVDRGEVNLTIRADQVSLDDVLLKALPTNTQPLATQFHLRGRTNVVAQVHRTRGAEQFANRFTISMQNAGLCYDQFPYPLDRVSGVLDILPDRSWELRDFCGHHGGGEIQASGRSQPLPPAGAGAPNGGRIDLDIHGVDVMLDRELEEALAPPSCPERRGMQQAVQGLRLGGPLSFTAHVVDLPNQPQDLDLSVSLRDCTLRPKFFDCPLTKVGAGVHYAHNRLNLSDMHAVHGTTQLSVREGLVLGKPGGGFYARLDGLSGRGLLFDSELTRALPPALRQGLEGLQLRGPIDLGGAIILDPHYGRVDMGASLVVDPPEGGGPPTVWWDGTVWLHDTALRAGLDMTGVSGVVACTGLFDGQRLKGVVGTAQFDQFTVLGQPVTGFKTRLVVPRGQPDVLELRDLTANLFGGSIGGEGRLEFRAPLRYDVVLRANRVRLEEFGKHNLPSGADIQGEARADLHISGEGTDISGLRGNGIVEVPEGKLYKLPLLLDLVKALGLRIPDGTAFEQARVGFALEGSQVRVTDLELVGNAVSLRGGGTLQLDGSDLNLNIHADWARLGYLLPPGLAWLPRSVSDQLLAIKVRGKVSDVKVEKQLVPAVTGLLQRPY